MVDLEAAVRPDWKTNDKKSSIDDFLSFGVKFANLTLLHFVTMYLEDLGNES
jgi:hypothetical protein